MKYSSVATALSVLISLAALVQGAPATSDHIVTRSSKPQPIARPAAVTPTGLVQRKREAATETQDFPGINMQPFDSAPTDVPAAAFNGGGGQVALGNGEPTATTAGVMASQPTESS
ncbi:unnamed protein product [Mortierella alpina]